MFRKIVADSSADLLELESVAFESVPLVIHAGEHEWVDDEKLDVNAMLDVLDGFRGRSGSACPSVDGWLQAFADADEVFCLPISKEMSGSYNTCCMAAKEYMEEHPERKVHVLDTRSTSATMALVIERLVPMVNSDMPFEQIAKEIDDYAARTRLLFCLRSVRSLASNGRMPQALATIIGLMNIRLVAIASPEGKGVMVDKARGDKKALPCLIENLKKMNFNGGRMIIHHCRNMEFSANLKKAVSEIWPAAEVLIAPTRGLCSYYAEDGGLLIGFEAV